MMGRTAKYSNAADRQKAYRERKKQHAVSDNPYTELIAEVEKQCETLRQIVMKYSRMGRSVEIYAHHDFGYAVVRDRHSLFQVVNPLIVRLMISRGEVCEIRRDWMGTVYQYSDHLAKAK